MKTARSPKFSGKSAGIAVIVGVGSIVWVGVGEEVFSRIFVEFDSVGGGMLTLVGTQEEVIKTSERVQNKKLVINFIIRPPLTQQNS
ncbi:hypothetical protein SDC9_139250 [bioreactor metagenome]|uniref:Uncharacterized protein n=1 Tax=bioreactor metagenome TaxID=1076179 RepID=A0A645DS13_9ZZZZ